jgi:cell division cycle 20, cofactor of APC complex
MNGHTARVSSLAWNGPMLSSGGRDSAIIHHDIRQARHLQSTFLGHQQEVCGLAWSPDGSTLASGGNENALCLWDAAMSGGGGRSSGSGYGASSRRLSTNSSSPRFRIEQHQAAVKALAWCPFQRNVLASGGGTADRTIRLWNASSGANLSVIDTGSQVQ